MHLYSSLLTELVARLEGELDDSAQLGELLRVVVLGLRYALS